LPSTQLHTDHDLFIRIAAGDETAFRELYDRYSSRLYGLALRMTRSPQDSEEILQETFLNLWAYKDKLSSVLDPPAYLFTTAYNKIYASLRHIAGDARLLQELISRIQDGDNQTLERLEFKESEALIKEAVDKLPPQRKLVYQLSRQEGLDYDQIAKRMGISRNTVRNHLVEALNDIRAWLQKSASLLILFELLKK
jgi:RNA polymerase sigma-70 factor (ECF subfamily)